MNTFYLILKTFPEECSTEEINPLRCDCERCRWTCNDIDRAKELGYHLHDAETSKNEESFFWSITEDVYYLFRDWPNLFTGDKSEAEDLGLEA